MSIRGRNSENYDEVVIERARKLRFCPKAQFEATIRREASQLDSARLDSNGRRNYQGRAMIGATRYLMLGLVFSSAEMAHAIFVPAVAKHFGAKIVQ